jgi:hypothetical protein
MVWHRLQSHSSHQLEITGQETGATTKKKPNAADQNAAGNQAQPKEN